MAKKKKTLVLVPAPMAETATVNPVHRAMTAERTGKVEAVATENRSKVSGTLADVVSKGTLCNVPTEKLFPLGEANPRKFFSDTDGLTASIQIEGIKEPLVVGTLSGEANAYVNRVNGTDFPDNARTYVFQGARRLKVVRTLLSEGIERFANVPCIDIGAIADKAAFERIVTDDTGRVNPALRCEIADKFGGLREAGYTLEAIGAMHGVSTGYVQTVLDVFSLPDTDEYPVKREIRKYDIEEAEIKRGIGGKDRERTALYLDTATVKDLALAWKLHNGGKPHGRQKRELRPFPVLWAEVCANGSKRPVTPVTSVKFTDVNEAVQTLANRIDGSDPVLVALKLFRDALSAAPDAATGNRAAILARIVGVKPARTLPDVAKPFAPITPVTPKAPAKTKK